MTDLIEKLRNPLWVHSNVAFDGPQLEKEDNLAAMSAAADEIERLRAQPEYLTGCQLHGPGECQSHGMCLSQACKHAGKTIRPRYMAEPREDGIKYPSFAEKNLIDRFGEH